MEEHTMIRRRRSRDAAAAAVLHLVRPAFLLPLPPMVHWRHGTQRCAQATALDSVGRQCRRVAVGVGAGVGAGALGRRGGGSYVARPHLAGYGNVNGVGTGVCGRGCSLVRLRQPVPTMATTTALERTRDDDEANEGGEIKEEEKGLASAPTSLLESSREVDVLYSTLGASYLFGDLPPDDLDRLVSAFEKVQYRNGTDIYRQGDARADYMYVLADGECCISVDGSVLPDPYGRVRAGAVLGERSLLYDEMPRWATVTASSDLVTLFRLDRASFERFLIDKPDADPAKMQHELRIIDDAIDKAGLISRYDGGYIIRPFKPARGWLWQRWAGTVLQHSWKIAIFNMCLSAATVLVVRHGVLAGRRRMWTAGAAPDVSAHPVLERLDAFRKLWKYLMNLTTFILTFFLSEAYGLWRKIYSHARKIQGRLNNIGMLVATSATRTEVTSDKDGVEHNVGNGNGDKDGRAGKTRYTPEAESLLNDVASYSRLFHVFMWAKFARRFRILLTPRGMGRLVGRGLLSPTQRDVLLGLDPTVGAHNAVLEWILIRISNAMRRSSISNGGGGGLDVSGIGYDDSSALKLRLYEDICSLRAEAGSVGDALAGRMPLAYAHFVQILVDTFLISAPFALYTELGLWSVASVGILTLFYSGLLDLAKIFLDPLNNDNFFARDCVNMDVGVLIREVNAGSTRWKLGAEVLPF